MNAYEIKFQMCLCPLEQKLRDLDAEMDSKIERCCPGTFITAVNKSNEQYLSCPQESEDPNGPNRVCTFDTFKIHTLLKASSTKPGVKLNDTHFTDYKLDFSSGGSKPGESHKISEEDVCVGQKYQSAQYSSGKALYQNTLFHCKSECKPGKPCLRKCPHGSELKNVIGKLKGNWKDVAENMIDRPELENKGQREVYGNIEDLLNGKIENKQPKMGKCYERFQLDLNGSEVQLKYHEKIFQQNEFCIDFDDSDYTLEAKIALPKEVSDDKFK